MTISRAPATNESCRTLEEVYAPVAADLAEVDRILDRELRGRRKFVDQLTTHAANYRGKRLRPALLLLAARACGEVQPSHWVLAAVVEMIHTATLVHDDVLDEASLRRNTTTINAHWGNESSVLLGDYLFSHAFYLASGLGSTKACRIIGRATNIVCEGELYQISERGNLSLDEDEYLEIISGKTAELYACSCRLGAHYCGASAEVEEGLTRFGRQLGIAFQIVDDLLDVVGDERVAGKSLGTDLVKQKCTLPVIRLLRQAKGKQARQLEALLADGANHRRQSLEPFLRSSDSVPYCMGRAEEFASAARQELGFLPASAARDALVELTRFVVSRRH